MKTKIIHLCIILVMVSSSKLMAQRSTWQPQTLPSPVYALYGVHFTDENNGWAVGMESFMGPAVVIHSSDGGQHWNKQNAEAGWALNGVFFIDPTTGWAVGEYGVIMHTADGGSNWATQSSGINDTHHLDGLFFVNETTGWAVGNGWSGVPGIIIKTTDGGSTWIQQSTGLSGTVFLLDVHFVDEVTGWAVGTNGVILKTTNAGANWVQQSANTDETITAVSFVDASTGWAVGYQGLILHTTDGGQNWVQQNSSHDGYIDGVCFVSATHGWAVGGGGTILHTTNGGSSWGITNVGSFNTRLYDVHFTDQTKGWVAGQGSSSGLMYHYAEGAAGIASQPMLNNLIAYPNPFTDRVVFEFIPDQNAKVTLKVFDAKGRLVHEAAQMSTAHIANQLIFKSENHHAGIYHYRLVVDSEVYSGKINLVQ